MNTSLANLTVYEPPYIPLSLHNAPRFGMPRSYLALFGPQRNQYIFGLLFAAVLITAFFVAWTVALVVLKCLGGEKVGFWSGRPFRIKFDLGTHDLLLKEQASADLEQDQQPEDSEGDKLPTLVRGVSLLSGTLEDGRLVVEERKDEEERTSHVADDENEDVGAPEFQLPSRRRETIIRSIFLLAGCLYLVFSVLVVTKGLARLQTTVEILSSITDQINYTIALLLHLCSKGLQEIADLTATLREQAAEELSTGSFCPRNPNLDKTSFGQELFRETTQAFNDLETLQDFLDTQVGPVSSGLLQAGKFITAANTAIRQIDLTSWQAMLALIPFSLLPTLLMAGAILAAFDATMRWYSWLINWLFVPLFWFVTTLAWIVSALMFMGGAVNGDFCLPGGRVEGAEPYWQPPDESVIRLLLAIGMNRNSTEYDIASYYVSQCFAPETTGPFQAISELIPRLAQTSAELQEANTYLSNTAGLLVLSLVCGRDFVALAKLVYGLEELVRLLIESADRFLEITACDRIVPLYVEAVYQGMCTYSPQAVFFVFLSTLVMGFSGMVMLSLRAAYKPTDFVDCSQKDKNFAPTGSASQADNPLAAQQMDVK